MSVPADTLFAAMFVPSCAKEKALAIKKTPARFLEPPSLRNAVRRLRGFHTAVPKIIFEDDDTIMPINEVTANPAGIVIS